MTLKNILVIAFLFLIGADNESLSPLVTAIDPQGKWIYVAEHSAKKIAILDRTGFKKVRDIDLPGKPTGMALSPDGSRLFTTLDNRLLIYDIDNAKILHSIYSGHGACSPTPSPCGGYIYVCNRFDNTVSIIDIDKGKATVSIPVSRAPVAAAVTPNGKQLLVANLLPEGPADQDFIGAVVTVIDLPAVSKTEPPKVSEIKPPKVSEIKPPKVSEIKPPAVSAIEPPHTFTIQLPNGSTGLRGICVSPDGRYAYATHILARYHLPTTQLERGWMNTNALSIIDLKKKSLLNSVLLDDVDLGAANPWDVACTEQKIVITHAGTHELSVIDQPGLLAKLASLDETQAVTVPNDLAFLVDIRRRIQLKGRGPRGLSLQGNTAFIAEYFSDSIGVVELDKEIRGVRSVRLGPEKLLTKERRGEILFNDGTVCFQQWQSCASCHPDGRTDGLNWDLLNDGFGNPKNTKSLLLSHATPPSMVMGVRDDSKAAVRAGLQFILFCVRPEADANAIDAYLENMSIESSPHLADGEYSDSAKRGKIVFEKAGCLACHPSPFYTDLTSYDLKSMRGPDKGKRLDTPTLCEVWRTAPYLHDGRADTLKSIFREHNSGDLHGFTSSLTAQELADMIEFVLSL